MTAWHAGRAPVTFTVDCAGEEHSVVWEEGELKAPDHDIASERALGALGGEPCACIRLLDAWSMRLELPELLRGRESTELGRIASANIGHLTTLLQSLVVVSAQASVAHEARSRLEQDVSRNRALKGLSSAGDGLIDLAKGDLIAHHLARQRDGTWSTSDEMMFKEFMSEAVVPLITSSMRAWRRLDAGAMITAECWLAAPDDEPSIFGWMSGHGGSAGVSLGLDWALSVLLEGIALVDDCFILERIKTGVDRDWHDVIAVRWEPQWNSASVSSFPSAAIDRIDRHFADRWSPRAAAALVFRSGDGWHLSWSSG